MNTDPRLRPHETHVLAVTPRTDRRGQALRLAWFASVALVIVGSLMPDKSLPMRALSHLNISDKIQHLGAYAILAFLPMLHERPQVVKGIAFALILLGVLLEFGQTLVTRDFEMGDMMADAVGVLVGMAAAWPLRRYLKLHAGR